MPLSIFEKLSNTQGEKFIWETDKKMKRELKTRLSSRYIKCFEFGKFSKKSGTVELRNFFLYESYLFYTKNGRIMAYINLDFTFIEFRKIEEEGKNEDDRFGCVFYIAKNERFCELKLLRAENIKLLRESIRPYVIFNDFFDRYKIDRTVGKGAFATVIRYVEKSTNEKYAVKIFDKKKLAQKQGYPQMVKNEIQISRKLDHRSIAKVHEAYETKKNVMIVTEYCNAGDLFDLKASILTREVDFNDIFYQILQAIFYLKNERIVHRDLKLENMMLKREKDKSYTVKLIDFGLAKRCEECQNDSQRNKICGTPGYIAPEILSGEFDDHHLLENCDIYSAGVIFFYLSCGRMPFEEGSFKQVLQRNKKGTIDRSALECSEAGEDVKDLIYKMLAKNLEERISVEEALRHKCFPYTSPEIKRHALLFEKPGSDWVQSTFISDNRLQAVDQNTEVDEDITLACQDNAANNTICNDSRKMGVLANAIVMKNKFGGNESGSLFIPLESVEDSSESSDLSEKLKDLSSPKPRLIKDFASSL